MDFSEIEYREGARFVWNTIPSNSLGMKQNMVPFGVFLTPFFNRDPPLGRRLGVPLKCQKCEFFVSPFCNLDYLNSRAWICANCANRNQLSNQILSFLSQGGTLAEFNASSSVYEYIVDNSGRYTRTVILVVDTSMEPEELESLKKTLIETIPNAESNVNLALVTFGRHVRLHNLVSLQRQEVVLDGAKTYTTEQLLSLLSLRQALPNAAPNQQHKFIQPAAVSYGRIVKIISKLKPDSFQILNQKENTRKYRCSGNALQISGLLASTHSMHGAKLATFLAGACTFGPGAIISMDKSKNFRSHLDLEKYADKLGEYQRAEKFYQGLIQSAVKFNISIDMFAFCLDQYGMGEMAELVQRTGGLVVNQEEFQEQEFSIGAKRYFDSLLGENTFWAARTRVLTTGELGLSGALGGLEVTKKVKALENLDNQMGASGGNEYYLGNCGSGTSHLFLFQHMKPDVTVNPKRGYFQFQSSYRDGQGNQVLRVATFARHFSSDQKQVAMGVDQEAAIACISRVASWKSKTLQTSDVVYWLNSVLIKLLRRTCEYTKDQPDSLQVAEQVSLLPQFIFYFRKSQFIQKFATSVDEFAFFRLSLFRETLNNMLVMIQPSLFAYSVEASEATPVLCDMDSLSDNRILVVDTYFFVLVWWGKTIQYWKQQGFHEDPEYEYFKNLLDMTQEDAALLMEDRVPAPKFIECWPGSPFERVLKSKLNPKAAKGGEEQDENYITDDVNLKTFMDYLVKLVVKGT